MSILESMSPLPFGHAPVMGATFLGLGRKSTWRYTKPTGGALPQICKHFVPGTLVLIFFL